jgi:hypothetical protein
VQGYLLVHASPGPGLLALNQNTEAIGAIHGIDEGYDHDLLNDTGKKTVMAEVLGWIGAR